MKILCIGRNYAKHAAELGNKVPSEPVFFGKPDSSLLRPNQPLFYPEFTSDLHYECELVVRIKKVGKHIQEKFAHKYYDEIALGIDLRRATFSPNARNRVYLGRKPRLLTEVPLLAPLVTRIRSANLMGSFWKRTARKSRSAALRT